MTIQEIKAKKRRLEFEILRMLLDFEITTETTINSISAFTDDDACLSEVLIEAAI